MMKLNNTLEMITTQFFYKHASEYAHKLASICEPDKDMFSAWFADQLASEIISYIEIEDYAIENIRVRCRELIDILRKNISNDENYALSYFD